MSAQNDSWKPLGRELVAPVWRIRRSDERYVFFDELVV
jgi:hypothetical protein